MENSFTCAYCRKTFPKGWSDEEAAQEAANLFPDHEQKDMEVVCDDCFKRIMAS